MNNHEGRSANHRSANHAFLSKSQAVFGTSLYTLVFLGAFWDIALLGTLIVVAAIVGILFLGWFLLKFLPNFWRKS